MNKIPVVVIFVRQSTESLNAQEERMAAASNYLVTRLYRPHAKAVGLHVREITVAFLTLETAVSAGV